MPAPAPVPRRTGAGSYGRPRGGQSSRAGVEPALQRHRAVRRRRGTSPRRPGCRPSCRSRAARRCLTGKADPGTRRRQVTASGRAGQARENGKYLRRLLSERHPEFLAILRWTEYRVDFELSRESPDWTSSRVPPIETGTGQDRPSSWAYPRRGSAASVLFLCASSVRQQDVQKVDTLAVFMACFLPVPRLPRASTATARSFTGGPASPGQVPVPGQDHPKEAPGFTWSQEDRRSCVRDSRGMEDVERAGGQSRTRPPGGAGDAAGRFTRPGRCARDRASAMLGEQRGGNDHRTERGDSLCASK